MSLTSLNVPSTEFWAATSLPQSHVYPESTSCLATWGAVQGPQGGNQIPPLPIAWMKLERGGRRHKA